MPIHFSRLTMTELRNRPGEVLDRTANDGEAFIIEKNGQQKAVLVPLSFFLPDISPKRIASELEKLESDNESPKSQITENKELVIRFSHALSATEQTEISVLLPHGYPNACPRVYASNIDEDSPHLWADGAMCIFGVLSGWNPGSHDVGYALKLARVWIENYKSWKLNGAWPEEN